VAAPTLTLAGTNINDGTIYTLLDEVDVGERHKTWSEYRGYNGLVAQYNVTEAMLVEMHFRILVKAASVTLLRQYVEWWNTTLDNASSSLVYNDGSGAITYNIVHSPRVNYVRNQASQNSFWTILEIVLYRLP
jgi:hypothetical protein